MVYMAILQMVKPKVVDAHLVPDNPNFVAYEIVDTPVKCDSVYIGRFQSLVVQHKSYSPEATEAMMDELRRTGRARWKLGPCVCRSLSGGSDFKDRDQILLGHPL
jgi:hypothetical protein